MSNPARPDLAAFAELRFLVQQVGEELSGMRKRAQTAEARLKQIASPSAAVPGAPALAAEERVAQLEAENARLRERLASAEEKTVKMLEQVRFIRQQHALEGGA